MDDIVIARAVGTDAQGIHLSNRRTWFATYPSEEYGITKDDVERRFHMSGTWEELQKFAARLKNPPHGEFNIVAKRDNSVVGFARFLRDVRMNELKAININPEFHGTGLAQKFWEMGLAHLNPHNPTKVFVAVYNARAIAFYKKLGFTEVHGTILDQRFTMHSGAIIPQMEMHRPPDAPCRP